MIAAFKFDPGREMMETEDPIIVPVSLSGDRCAKLQIPRDLTKDEAEKISRVVLAYASASQ